jgi:hypothetical protein
VKSPIDKLRGSLTRISYAGESSSVCDPRLEDAFAALDALEVAAVKLDICLWCTKTLAECTCYGAD